jgi:hypothetical protein
MRACGVRSCPRVSSTVQDRPVTEIFVPAHFVPAHAHRVQPAEECNNTALLKWFQVDVRLLLTAAIAVASLAAERFTGNVGHRG